MSRSTARKPLIDPSKPLWLSADLELDDAGDDAPKRMHGVAYSGGLIPGWNCVIDLASTEANDSMPLLLQHEQEKTIGVIKASNDQAAITVAGDLFTDIDEDARKVALKAKRGLRYQMSVGLYSFSAENFDAGTTASVNGRDFAGPVTVLRRGKVRECSVAALGADPNTSATFFAADASAPAASATESAMPEPTAQDARITDLEAQLSAMRQRAETAETALAETAKAARLSEVRSLFKATGREFSDAAAAPYLAMSADSFAAVSADLTAVAKKLPAYLFSEQARGPSPTSGQSALMADASRRGWVKSVA